MFSPVLYCTVLPCPALFCPVLPCPTPPALPCSALFCTVLQWPALSCPVLPFVLCPVLYCLAMSCPVLWPAVACFLPFQEPFLSYTMSCPLQCFSLSNTFKGSQYLLKSGDERKHSFVSFTYNDVNTCYTVFLVWSKIRLKKSEKYLFSANHPRGRISLRQS